MTTLTKDSTPAEVREQWVAELRSGRYQQGNSQLRQPAVAPYGTDAFCCLGVLCDMAAQAGLGGWEDERFWLSRESYGGYDKYPPAEVALWAGLAHPAGTLDGDKYNSLANMNDDGMSFAVIADLIDQGLVKTL